MSGIGQVETRFATLCTKGDPPFVLQGGEQLEEVTLAYEIYGEPNEARDNVVLLFHAMTGSQHAAGINTAVDRVGDLWTDECHPGWWDDFMGPGKALDTREFCVVCANYLGGCYGSTGPGSPNPATGRPYGGAFPRISIADIVDSQMRLLDHLGIQKLHAAIGASVGGMMCLSLATRYPDRVAIVIPVASGIEVTPLQRILNFEQVQAIEEDTHFRGGDFYDGERPDAGLALARMISHKTFISLSALEMRARSEIVRKQDNLQWYQITSPVESYMLHQGKKFVKRFDANTFLRILDAWQRFDLVAEGGADDLPTLLARCRGQKYLVFSIDSDVSFYPEQQQEMVNALRRGGVEDCMRITVHSDKGHDSFLLEPHLFAPHLDYCLNKRLSSPGPSS